MSFLSDYEVYASAIYYNNKKFIPKQLEDYFEQTEKQDFADSEMVKKVVDVSKKIFKNIISKHSLTMDQVLQAETSKGGKALAHLALLHCDICSLVSTNYKNFDDILNDYSCWETYSG